MGFLKHLPIETKVFVLSLEGAKCICIIERSRKVTKEMVLSCASAHWFANTLEECSLLVSKKDLCKTYQDGDKAIFAHQHSNAFGRYQELAEYGGSVCQGVLLILEGMEGRG